jgi:hypothetical protein
MLEHSVYIQQGETKLDAYRRGLKELDQIAAELRKEHESMRGQIISETIQGAQRTNPPIGPPMPLEINRKHDELKDLIDDCSTIEELKAWKEVNPVLPVPVQKHYDTKVEILRIERDNKLMGKQNSINHD